MTGWVQTQEGETQPRPLSPLAPSARALSSILESTVTCRRAQTAPFIHEVVVLTHLMILVALSFLLGADACY